MLMHFFPMHFFRAPKKAWWMPISAAVCSNSASRGRDEASRVGIERSSSSVAEEEKQFKEAARHVCGWPGNRSKNW